MKYPGGFADLIAKMIGVDINDEMKRAIRIPTSILLLTFTITPFVLHQYPIAILPLAFLGLFEGFVIMQKTITMMIGYKYSYVFKNIKKQWQK